MIGSLWINFVSMCGFDSQFPSQSNRQHTQMNGRSHYYTHRCLPYHYIPSARMSHNNDLDTPSTDIPVGISWDEYHCVEL